MSKCKNNKHSRTPILETNRVAARIYDDKDNVAKVKGNKYK